VQRQKVILDCDNTMGLDGRDVDDALALLYLLGRPEVELVGVTTTFGNGTLEEVQRATERLFEALGIRDRLSLVRGAASPDDRGGPAARFLAGAVRSSPGRILILATGAPSNLYGARQLDERFFTHAGGFMLMGGVTEPLVIGGRSMDELNLSSDPEAARILIGSGAPVSIVTGNLCLPALLDAGRVGRLLRGLGPRLSGVFGPPIERWAARMRERCGLRGFHLWDVVAAVYLTTPELFEDRTVSLVSTPDDLARGLLRIEEPVGGSAPCVRMPTRICDMDRFWKVVMRAWLEAGRILDPA